MHREVLDWLRKIRKAHPALFDGGYVLECGAGNNTYPIRGLFPLSRYTGLDVHGGPGVDVVGLVHEYQPEQQFDLVLSLQMLEHDPYWRKSLQKMTEFLKPGGSLILTFAGPGYPVHDPQSSPIWGYYENRTLDEVESVLDGRFTSFKAEQNHWDVYCLAMGKK